MCTSTDSSNLLDFELLDERDRLGGRVLVLAVVALARLEVCLAVLGHQSATSTPIERAVPAMIFAAWSRSLALRSSSFVCAISRSCAWVIVRDLVAVGLGGALVEPERLLDQHGGRRALRDEREGAVLEDRDLDGHDGALLRGRLGVERLDELHDVDAVLTQGGADRRGRARLTGGSLELDDCQNLLGH